MEALQFDRGIREYRVGAGVLRFNPTDPNLYSRFLDALTALEALEREIPQEGAIAALRSMDAKVKAILQEVFGPENDIEAIFAGVNLLALGDNGQRLLTNFAAALEPILTQGARACAQAENKA